LSKILVVDDNEEMCRLLKTVLEFEGHQVVAVSSYAKIMPTVRQVLPDIAVMDLRVQGEQTLAVVRQMRREEKLKYIPIVMTSGMDLGQECLDAGADKFIMKPFLPDDLIANVKDLLERDDTKLKAVRP